VAEPLGVELIVEPVNRYEVNFINNCTEGLEIVRAAGRKCVRLMPARLIRLARPGVFSHLGLFSGGSITMEDVASAPGFTKQKVKLVFIGYGTRELSGGLGAPPPRANQVGGRDGRDFFGSYPRERIDALKKAGFHAVFYFSTSTAHEWQTWRRSLCEFAPLLFKE